MNIWNLESACVYVVISGLGENTIYSKVQKKTYIHAAAATKATLTHSLFSALTKYVVLTTFH